MDRIKANGAELEVETRGSGEPLVLIHGSITGETMNCLLNESALTDSYQVTHYHRRGFLGSSPLDGPYTMAQQALDALEVVKQVAGGRAHIAGHSYGAATALQLTLQAPGAVHTLALLEPPMNVPSAAEFFGQMGPVDAAYAAGDKAAATKGFLELVLGAGNEELCEPNLPDGWFDRAVADIDTFFQVELPNLWQITEEEARRITQPVLSVVGENSEMFFKEGHALLLRWMPQAEGFVLPGATHGLQFMNPKGMAAGLTAFMAKHPMKATAAV